MQRRANPNLLFDSRDATLMRWCGVKTSIDPAFLAREE